MATYTGADKAVGYLFTASNNTAAEYSAAETYAVGDFVIYDGTLYKCTSAISSPEAWTPAHWTQTTIMENAGGGGGGGTTVIANPAGAATDTLNKLQVGATIYDIPSGGGSSHTYSTTEQIIGTWINGKTIYERTYEFTPNILCNYNTWTDTTIPKAGIDTIIDFLVIADVQGLTPKYFTTGFDPSSNYVRLLHVRPNVGINLKTMVLRYTKS